MMKKSFLCFLLVLSLLVGLSASAVASQTNSTLAGGANVTWGTGDNRALLQVGSSYGGQYYIQNSAGTGAYYNGSTNYSVPYGENVKLIAEPLTGYKFIGWYDGIDSGDYVTDYDISANKSFNSTYELTVTSTTKVYALFVSTSASAKVSLKAETGGSIDWVEATGSSRMKSSVNEGQEVVLYTGYYMINSSAINLKAKPAEDYSFKGWYISKNGTETLVSTNVAYTWTMLRDVDTTMVARFEEENHSHIWGEPTYAWSDDNSSVTATRVCQTNSSHIETETVTTTSTTISDATCTTSGKSTYTATFQNRDFEAQTKTIDIAAFGHDWDNGTITTDPSCETTGIRTYTCQNDPSHTKAETIAALGHNWGTWTITKEPTETSEGEQTRTCSRCGEKETQAIPRLVIEYTNTEGDGGTWEKESTGNLKFTFKRNYNDDVTFEKFQGKVEVDGKKIDEENYTVAKGSLIVTLKQAYLDTLSTGKHTLTVYFTDYRQPVNATFTVEGKRVAYDVPKTGDDEPLLLWTLITLVGLSLVLGVIWTGKQRKIRK